MADRSSGPRPGIRPWQYDHEWSADVASADNVSVRELAVRAVRNVRSWQHRGGRTLDEALDVIGVIYQAYQKQLQRQSYLHRMYQKQLRRERNLRRMYQGQLQSERTRRRDYQMRLRDERARRRQYEQQLQRQRTHYEQRARTAAEAHHTALYSAKVARLLNLAVCSQSEGEATAALVKARVLRRLAT